MIHIKRVDNGQMVYEKKVYVQECKFQGLAREGGQDTLQKKTECQFFQFLPKEKKREVQP